MDCNVSDIFQLSMWHETGHRAEVTCIQQSPNKDIFAVGYADGSIRLWDQNTQSVIATFNGHKKAISALAFDQAGFRLASGSQDTDLILWDVVGEAGLFRYETIRHYCMWSHVAQASWTSGSSYSYTIPKRCVQ
jgi:U3 small nucleolar RNA-associated protein 12